MIDLYYWTTPNGHKIANFLEEADFSQYAPEKLPYAIDRYVKETNRLYGVLNKRLADREFIAGEYSIADMATYPWIVPWERQGQNLDDFPHLKRWFESIKPRPAAVSAPMTRRTDQHAADRSRRNPSRILFGQTAAAVGD